MENTSHDRSMYIESTYYYYYYASNESMISVECRRIQSYRYAVRYESYC
jgi:hypothetical protein